MIEPVILGTRGMGGLEIYGLASGAIGIFWHAQGWAGA